ncbi:O-antigen ligase family protein [Mucilaginibacter mali]|uniref:O-antigen ligase family protein n=1 Tax=Mucilaginibacter mali TaxID=2740462 RepID=A0A7D4QAD8_9SPHI|nr:O-antigen ligase family protein [Mucilaginibacter mali]QKJ29924.1 O-antigen ligase family protein [Mucilaginibacter mali]
MKALFLIDDTTANRISYYHIMLMLATLPFDQFFSHAAFISFALHTLIHLDKTRLKALFTPRTLLLQAVFFITLSSALYSKYPATAGVDITRQLVILLFPVFFALTTLNINKYRDKLLTLFALVCVLVIAGLYVRAFYVIHYFHLPVRAIISNLFINHKFSGPINMHATFLSLQIALALFYLLTRLFEPRSVYLKTGLYIAVILLFAGIVQLGSKAVLVVVLIGINVVIPYFMVPVAKRLRFIAAAAVLSLIVIASSVSVNGFKERFVTDLANDLSKPVTNESVEPRLVRWEAAIQLVKKRPVFGYGAGSELSILGDKYFHDKLYIAYLNRLNAHNQYLTFLLTSGMVGLLIYLATLFYAVRTALWRRDMLFFVFTLLIITVSLSESLLNAEKGVYFYSFFLSFFVFGGIKKAAKSNYLFT